MAPRFPLTMFWAPNSFPVIPGDVLEIFFLCRFQWMSFFQGLAGSWGLVELSRGLLGGDVFLAGQQLQSRG